MALKTRNEAPVGRELYVIKTGDWRFQKPVVDKDKCTRCGICFIFCPTNSIRKADDGYEADLDTCKGCGICANECHSGAVVMEMEKRE